MAFVFVVWLDMSEKTRFRLERPSHLRNSSLLVLRERAYVIQQTGICLVFEFLRLSQRYHRRSWIVRRMLANNLGVSLHGLGRGPRTEKHKQLNPFGMQSYVLTCFFKITSKAVLSLVKRSPKVRGRPFKLTIAFKSFCFTLIAGQQRNYKVRPLKRSQFMFYVTNKLHLDDFSEKCFNYIQLIFIIQALKTTIENT